MIGSIKHKGLKRLYENDNRKLIRPDLVDRCASILALLDAASEIEGIDRPALHLHPLKGDRRGFWAVTVRANWRIVFRFEGGAALDVDLIDYH